MRAGFVTLLTLFAIALSLPNNAEAQQQQQQQPAANQTRPNQTRPAVNQPPTDQQQRIADQRKLSAQPLPAAVRKPMQPEWASTISQKHADYLKQLLSHWEKSSSQVNHYKCDFMRWDYSSDFSWRNLKTRELTAFRVSSGEIQYSNPDRARYETTKAWSYGKPENPNTQPPYEPTDQNETKERWLCDGKTIFNYDFQNKKLYETDIPKEMQGKGLMETPLPFFFGAKANDLLERYWVRIVTPEDVKNEYWMEAVPKRASDAQAYKKLVLVISETDFLPQSLEIYAQNYDEKNGQHDKKVFVFKNRKRNSLGMSITAWKDKFVRPQTPIGWDRVNTAKLQPAQNRERPQALQRPAAMPTTQKRR